MGMQLHIAPEMSPPDVLAAPERLVAHGIQPLSFLGEPAYQPSVPAPGSSAPTITAMYPLDSTVAVGGHQAPSSIRGRSSSMSFAICQ
jgi:hypothetical protein